MDSYLSISSITSAMVAWNEMYQGYPDHWVKVHGNLLTASEYSNDDISKEIKAEADHFYKMKISGTKYRPPFEKLSCDILNDTAGEEIIADSDVINGSLCYNCSIKHLSEAFTSFDNVNEDIKIFMSILGNMSHASNHLIEESEELANEIREERTLFYESYMKNESYIYRPDFESLLSKVKVIAQKDFY